MKAVVFILLIVLLLGLCVGTCPNWNDHYDTTKDLIKRTLSQDMYENEEDPFSTFLVSEIGGTLGGLAMKAMLHVDNYLLFSVGKVDLGGESYVVSIGLLNHVFTIDEAELLEVMQSIFID